MERFQPRDWQPVLEVMFQMSTRSTDAVVATTKMGAGVPFDEEADGVELCWVLQHSDMSVIQTDKESVL